MIQCILMTTLFNKSLSKTSQNASRYKLNFQDNLDNRMSKVDKTIELLLKLQAVLPRSSHVTYLKSIYKTSSLWGYYSYMTKLTKNHFIKNQNQHNINAAPVITGAIRVVIERNFTMKQAQNLFKNEFSLENCATFKKYLRFNLWIIFRKYSNTSQYQKSLQHNKY